MRIPWVLAGVVSLCGVAGAQIRINAAGPAFTDPSGSVWAADTGFAGGLTWSVGSDIGGTASPALYQTCRYGEFVYRFNVPAGNYTVNLKFAEVSQTRVGARVFNVDINGANVLANFDIFAAAGGMNVAVDRSFSASAAGGQIAIAFRNGPANSPLISAIEILPAGGGATATSLKLNAAGPAFTDGQGATWSADTGFTGGMTWSVNSAIAGTASPVLYQTCRYGEFSYSLPVAAGNYTVNLKFAEVSQTRVGARVFNVDINGANVLTNFDIFAQSGGMNIALDKAFPVTSTGSPIVVTFRNGAANSPLISAIEILPAGSIRVNTGGAAFTDLRGALWSGDTAFSGGLTWSVNSAIAGTDSPALYQTCRYGQFAYSFPVAAGNYTVNLKFAEVSQTRAGARVFNVDINGANVLANFDVFAQAGGMNIALDKAFPVTSTGNPIVVTLRNGASNSPLINAIEIVPAGGTAPVSCGISGQVTGAGASVTLSGATLGSTSTDATGRYSFSGLANGSYVVSPSQSGYAFTPSATTVTINGTAVTGVNYTGTPVSVPPPHSVTLNWMASSSPNVIGYNVYRATGSGGPYVKVNGALVAATTYLDCNVAAGQSYYYVATSVNGSNNESAYSTQATSVVPAP